MNKDNFWEWERKWAERFGARESESNGSAEISPDPVAVMKALSQFDLHQLKFFKEYLEAEIARRTYRP